MILIHGKTLDHSTELLYQLLTDEAFFINFAPGNKVSRISNFFVCPQKNPLLPPIPCGFFKHPTKYLPEELSARVLAGEEDT